MAPIARAPGMNNTQDWAPVGLPFLKPSEQRPGPLPDEREILEGKILCGDASNHCIVAFGEHFIAKYGCQVHEIEGQNLLFLEQYSGNHLTTPKLYAMWRMVSTGHICIVMQRLPGESLETLWPQLMEVEKLAVCTGLRKALEDLRQLPSPGFYGGIGRTPLPFHLFWDLDGRPAICGPFDSEAELNAGIVQKLREQSKMNRGYMDQKVSFYERNLNFMLREHDPVFSHSDLQRKNILVHRHAGVIVDVAIIDWEYAGWYPSYWEYCLEFASAIWEDDWLKRLEEIIAPWPCEAAVLRILYQELYF